MKPRLATWIAVLVLTGATAGALAQQQQSQQQSQQQQQSQSQQPQPPTGANPVRPLYQPADTTSTPPADQITESDKRPVAGIEAPTMGSSIENLNSLYLGIQVAQMADSNSGVMSGANRIETVSTMGGDIMLTRTGKRGQFSMHYVAGGVVFPKHMEYNNVSHNFEVSQALNFGRWTFSLVDTGSYAPESPWGGAFGGSFDEFTRGHLNPGLEADQGIFTTRSPRWTNTAAGQLQYQFTPRTSWTGFGSYSMLRFVRSGLIDSDQYMAGTGYSWQASPKDSVGFSYSYSQYRPRGGTWYRIHGWNALYSRRVTGRMSLGASAGAGLARDVREQRIAWSAGAQMDYTRGGRTFQWFYGHAYGASSGAFYQGVENDQAGVAFMTNLRWRWSAGSSVEIRRFYRRGGTDHITSGYAGAEISRSIGRYSSVYFSYGFGRQVTDPGIVSVDIPSNMSRHVVIAGYRWNFRPITLGR